MNFNIITFCKNILNGLIDMTSSLIDFFNRPIYIGWLTSFLDKIFNFFGINSINLGNLQYIGVWSVIGTGISAVLVFVVLKKIIPIFIFSI